MNFKLNRLIAEMQVDYRAFKAAGLLKEWRRKWATRNPANTNFVELDNS